MSIFRNEHADLSAFIDGELGPLSARRVDSRLSAGELPEERLRALRSVRDAVRATAPDDAARMEEARARVRARLERSLAGAPASTRVPLRHRSLNLPLPAAAAAALVMMALTVLGTLSLVRPDSAARAGLGTAETGSPVNVQVNVDGGHTRDLIEWLDDQESVQTVTIQLPESAQFRMRGEPVIMRADLRAAEEQYEIVPLEDSGE